jgi:SPOR domain
LSTRTILGKGFMATPINAPMAAEIWHLSIEDLFQPVEEAPRLGGNGPFVINLSASTAPIDIPTKPFAESRDAHVYHIQVTEDGRTRYRLRLGPFVTEDEADAILAEVRDTYPGALTATAGTADLRAIGTIQAKLLRQPSAQKPIENAVPEKAVQEKAVSEKATLEKVAPEKFAPEKVEAKNVAPAKLSAEKADAEIAIDIAWPTPELVVPPAAPLRAAETFLAAAPRVEIPPAVVPPLELAPEWALPELDIPQPIAHIPSPVAKVAPVLTEAVAAVPKPVAPKAATPVAAAPKPIVAPVVAAPKPIAPRMAPSIAVASVAPVLTQVVAPKSTSPPPLPAVKQVSKTAGPIAPATPVFSLSVAVTLPAARIPASRPTPPATQAVASAKSSLPKNAAPITAAKPAQVPTHSVMSPPRASAMKFGQPASKKPLATRLTSLQHVVVATASSPAVREVRKLDQPLDSLESTQTMRALTPTELDDSVASRWFVIQLALADQAFDPDAVPNLDIFSEYRLYSVAGQDQGRVVHALRLGFFREEIGAVAVASYLAAFWDKPTIKRVSLAERERFADHQVEARKDVGATGKHAAIEITDELVARRRRSPQTSASAKTSNHPI